MGLEITINYPRCLVHNVPTLDDYYVEVDRPGMIRIQSLSLTEDKDECCNIPIYIPKLLAEGWITFKRSESETGSYQDEMTNSFQTQTTDTLGVFVRDDGRKSPSVRKRRVYQFKCKENDDHHAKSCLSWAVTESYQAKIEWVVNGLNLSCEACWYSESRLVMNVELGLLDDDDEDIVDEDKDKDQIDCLDCVLDNLKEEYNVKSGRQSALPTVSVTLGAGSEDEINHLLI